MRGDFKDNRARKERFMPFKSKRVAYAEFSAAILFLAFALSALMPGSAYAASAQENYRFYCAQCHGLRGMGDGPNALESMPVSPRDHTNARAMGKLTDEDIMNAIADGGASVSKSSLMPAFGKTLTDREIRDLKDYLRKLCKCRAK